MLPILDRDLKYATALNFAKYKDCLISSANLHFIFNKIQKEFSFDHVKRCLNVDENS